MVGIEATHRSTTSKDEGFDPVQDRLAAHIF